MSVHSKLSTVEANGSAPDEGILLHAAIAGHRIMVSPLASGVAEAFSRVSAGLGAGILRTFGERQPTIDQTKAIGPFFGTTETTKGN